MFCEKVVCKHYWAFVWLSIKATSLGLRAGGEQRLKLGLGTKNGSIGPGIKLNRGFWGAI